jgi:Zn-dependent peptidase ImmA (M78 family)
MSEKERLYSNASELLSFLEKERGFEIKAPVDIDGIASELNILVDSDFSLDQKDIIGEISFKEGKPIVKINPLQNSYSPRRRFTIAHEIGHYCLHSAQSKGFTDSRKTMSRTDSYWDKYESEANSFAAQLLMPTHLIIREGQKVIEAYKKKMEVESIPQGTFIEAMADKFSVSSKAMEYRLKNLSII